MHQVEHVSEVKWLCNSKSFRKLASLLVNLSCVSAKVLAAAKLQGSPFKLQLCAMHHEHASKLSA